MAFDGLPAPRSNPLRLASGHYAVGLLSASIVAIVLLNFQPHVISAGYVLLSTALIFLVVWTFTNMRRHDRSLCEQCMVGIPLNPAEHAETHLRRRFWVAHLASRRWLAFGYVGVVIASNFLTSAGGRFVWAGLTLSMIYPLLSYDSHRRFQPWCPWCSEGGGGSDDTVDAPDPVMPSGLLT